MNKLLIKYIGIILLISSCNVPPHRKITEYERPHGVQVFEDKENVKYNYSPLEIKNIN